MKHYVLGFVFDRAGNEVLLIEKKRPEWQAGRWNGIGGKIGDELGSLSEHPLAAMQRESLEEISYGYAWQHCITFICPGGTVFVFRAFSETICFIQKEDELLQIWQLNKLPTKIMSNLKWLIPVCLSTIHFPLLVLDTTLGIKSLGEK